MKDIKKKKSVIIYIIILIIIFPLFIGIGYIYSHYSKKYEMVYVGKPVTSLNYNTQSGDTHQIAAPLDEGAIITSIDISNFNTVDDEDLQNKLNSYKIDKNNEEFSLLNENEKSLVILAQTNEEGMKKAKEIINFFRPITFIGDDPLENVDTTKTENANKDGISIPAYAMGFATEIYTNNDYTSFRIRIMDGSEDKNKVARWSNGDEVKAEDIAFGTSRQIISTNAARGAYMLGLSGIKGMNYAISSDSDLKSNDKDRFDVDGDGNYDSEMSIGYGLTPNSRKVFEKLNSNQSFDEVSQSNAGIVYYDSTLHNDNDYSFIQYNLADDKNNPTGSNTFPTMLSSQSFLPINMIWFQNKFGMTSKMSEFGISANTYLSNGPFTPTYFDNLYGYTYTKNKYYHDVDLIPTNTGAYRFMNEPSTEVAMFKNGSASAVEGQDATAKVLLENKNVNQWVKPKFTSPQTRYLFFNLGNDNVESKNSKYYKDPNFRRAIWYAFDRTTYHSLSGLTTTQPTSIFTAKGMYSDTIHGDFIDYASNTEYNVLGQSDPIKLESFDSNSRLNGLKNPEKYISNIDPNRNIQLSNYYFEKFLDDMDQLGVEKPGKGKDQIVLQYITINGDKDPYYKTLQEKVTNDSLTTIDGLEVASYVDIYPTTVTPATFWDTYYSGKGYDMASMKWLPDYLDIWSILGVFNQDDKSRGSNGTGSWNFWDGSDYTLEDKNDDGSVKTYQYGSLEKDNLARSLFNDGLSSIYENNSDLNIETIKNNFENYDFLDVANKMAKAVIEDNDSSIIINDESSIKNYFQDYENRIAMSNGINHNKHTSDIWSNYTVPAYLILEIILKDSGSVFVGASETESITPSKLILEGDPVIGYSSRGFAFDLTKIKSTSYWYDSREKIKEILLPS